MIFPLNQIITMVLDVFWYRFHISDETESNTTVDSKQCSVLYMNIQEPLPVIEIPTVGFIELGTFIFKTDADPTASAASTMDSALPTVFSPTATADSAADSTAKAAFEAALRAAPKNPPPIEERPNIFEYFQ